MNVTQNETESRTLTTTRVGRFSYNTVAGIWDWDDHVFRIHGLQPWSLTPTTEHMLSCEHPEDRARVHEALARAESDGEPCSVSYRLAAADGVDRRVLLVCEAGVRTEDDSISAINGYYIDLTEDFRQESAEVARDAVAQSARHRSTIERAVGALMVTYGLDADQAFGMLRWWSQNTNVKVRDLAGRLTEAASSGAASSVDIRKAVDVLLHDVSTRRPSPIGDTSPPG